MSHPRPAPADHDEEDALPSIDKRYYQDLVRYTNALHSRDVAAQIAAVTEVRTLSIPGTLVTIALTP